VAANRATSAFAGQPQPVEIHHRGIWYSGELLGWRHESDGVVDKLRHSTWKDLAELRLPDPARPPRAEPFPAPAPRLSPAEREGDDATQPHVLLASMQGRPAKPAHALTPPAPRDRAQRRPAPAACQPATIESDRRRWTRTEQTASELSGV
jgi:hypothetical protein